MFVCLCRLLLVMGGVFGCVVVWLVFSVFCRLLLSCVSVSVFLLFFSNVIVVFIILVSCCILFG